MFIVAANYIFQKNRTNRTGSYGPAPILTVQVASI